MIFTLKCIYYYELNPEFESFMYFCASFSFIGVNYKKKMTWPELSHCFRELGHCFGFFAAGFVVMKADMYIYKQKIVFAYMFIFVCILSL